VPTSRRIDEALVDGLDAPEAAEPRAVLADARLPGYRRGVVAAGSSDRR